MKISEVSKIDKSFRIDAEFFKKEYVSDQIKLFLHKPINLIDVALKIDVGFVGSMVNEYSDNINDPILLQTKNIDEFFVNFNDIKRINNKFHKELKKSQISKEDILIARSGSFGKACIYLSENIINSSDIIIVRANKDNINPYFLVSFLNSKLGKNQLFRFASGGLQGHVNLTILENLKVPTFTIQLQNTIEKLVKEAYYKYEKSKSLYLTSEIQLLSELGLKDWQPTKSNTNSVSFSNSYLQSGRLDAEYYQPKYEEIYNILKSKANYIKYISEIKTFNARGLQPEYLENGELDIINSRHILDKSLDYENFEKTNIKNWESQERARVFKNDILIYTTGANIGRTNIYLKESRALASNHVNILRIKDENQIYVAFVMNTIIGKLQTEKLSAGSAQQELYPKDIEMFYIPFVNKKIQTQISEKIQQSYTLKSESKQLLELAKQALEIAIEIGEKEGIKLLKNIK